MSAAEGEAQRLGFTVEAITEVDLVPPAELEYADGWAHEIGDPCVWFVKMAGKVLSSELPGPPSIPGGEGTPPPAPSRFTEMAVVFDSVTGDQVFRWLRGDVGDGTAVPVETPTTRPSVPPPPTPTPIG